MSMLVGFVAQYFISPEVFAVESTMEIASCKTILHFQNISYVNFISDIY